MGYLGDPRTILWGWLVALSLMGVAFGISYRDYLTTRDYALTQFEDLLRDTRDLRVTISSILADLKDPARLSQSDLRRYEGQLERVVLRLNRKVPDYGLEPFFEEPLFAITEARLNLLSTALALERLIQVHRLTLRLSERKELFRKTLETYQRDYENYLRRPGSFDLSDFLPTRELAQQLEDLSRRLSRRSAQMEALEDRVEAGLKRSQGAYEPQVEAAISRLAMRGYSQYLAFLAGKKDLRYLRQRLHQLAVNWGLAGNRGRK